MSVTQIIDGLEVVLDDSERQPVECFTRVMGYHRPVSFFNIGKRREFEDRLPFCTAKTEQALRAPRPPHELVDALQDRIHPTSGRLLAAKPVDPGFRTRVLGVTTPVWRNHAAAAPTAPDDLYCYPCATGKTTGYSAGTVA